jgi:GTP-binding protein
VAKLPVVAIIGRPNVGKSTLFNRLLKRREAIVDDRPGVTRDRKVSTVEWQGAFFDLMDTGGYLPLTSDVFLAAIREQVHRAVKEADLLLFLVDAKEGITPIDEEIAKIVRASEKKCLLVVNKADNKKIEQSVYEFYSLGLGDPVAVSAESGRKIGDLLDLVVENLPEAEAEPEETEKIHLAVIGKPNVGKSSFVNAVLGEEKVLVTEIPGTTRDSVDTRFRYMDREFILIDTAGLRKKSRIKDSIEYYSAVRTRRSIERSDVTVVMIDAAEGLTHQDKAVIALAIARKKGVVLAVNKWDLIDRGPKMLARYEAELKNKLRNLDYIPIIMISCKTGLRVQEVLQVALSVYEERKKRIPTSELNRKIGDILREQPPLVKDARPIKVHYLTQVKAAPPVFALFTNRPEAIAANYRRFVEKKIREQFGFLGVPITLAVRKK